MNLQSILYASIILLVHLNKASSGRDENPDLVISQSGVDGVTPCGIGLKFFIELNNTSDKHDYEVEVSADQCCLEADGSLDCDVLELLGDCVGFIPKGAIKTVRMIAPVVDPIERRGYCILYLDSKCSYNGRNKRDTVKVSFDTKLKKINEILQTNIKPCRNIDEDPLNDCKPVDCEIYYNSRKPYYNKKLKKCEATPPCVPEFVSEIPNAIYDPVSNRCIKGKSITKRDVNYLKKLNSKHRPLKDILIIRNFKEDLEDNKTNPGLNNAIDKVPMCKKCDKIQVLNPGRNLKHKGFSVSGKCSLSYLINYIKNNKYTFIIFGAVISLQCCVIVGIVYYFTTCCAGCKDKKVIRKFFNYRQDASVTTPLIGTSNMDTETDYHFESESTNVEKKLKCYKACQKEKNNNVKMSFSDDILSKCVNRRNWSRQEKKTGSIQEANNEAQINMDSMEGNAEVQPSIELKEVCETKVVIEDEKPKAERDKLGNKIGSIPKCLNKDIIDREREVIEESDSSEQEIQCHSYNNNITSNLTGFKPGTDKNFGYCRTGKTIAASIKVPSTNKEAQASFSNDTIDDYLSERGIYLADNISKYTFDSDPTKMSTPPLSSKTSKYHFIRNVMSLLQKKSRTSDPGSKKDLDVQLIHMSRGSICSTSNDSACINCRQKGSRTSF